MQRRAAAIYFALFVVIGAGAFGFIQVGTTQPEVDLGTEIYTEGDSFSVGGQSYSISNLSLGAAGTEGEGTNQLTLSWTNDSVRATASLANDSTTTYQGEEYTVVIENRSDVSSFSLREVQNVTAILSNDPAVEDEVATVGDREYAVRRSNDSLIPLSEYLPEPETLGPFAEGETYDYTADGTNVTATIQSVTPSAATLTWQTSEDRTNEGITEGTNVTLAGTEYFVHFVGGSGAQIAPTDQYLDEYQQQLAVEDNWYERIAGLWGIVIVSFMAAVLLLGAAYMPVKE